jgi:hypothetical protein
MGRPARVGPVENHLAQSETTEVTILIALYKALGGRWDALTE